jgi:hypothetical protein
MAESGSNLGVWQCETLRVSPAMAVGIAGSETLKDIVSLIDAQEGAPKKRGPYKKREAV